MQVVKKEEKPIHLLGFYYFCRTFAARKQSDGPSRTFYNVGGKSGQHRANRFLMGSCL